MKTATRTDMTSERGASPVSVLIVLGIIFLIAELIVMGGRVAAAHNDISAAARQAARQGSLAAGPGSASAIIRDAAGANLTNSAGNGTTCADATYETDTSNFDQGGRVGVKVHCTVDLSDLSLLSLPWPTKVFTAEHSEVIETYRVVE